MHERIPRVMDPVVIGRMMDHTACRLDSVDDAWHVLCASVSSVAWRGHSILKNQFDLARYFYLIENLRPEVIVETGLQSGGSVLFFLDALAMLGMRDTRYIGIDLDATRALAAVEQYRSDWPAMFISADCLADATIREVTPYLAGRRALVVLDSVHSEEHVTEELRRYAPLCSAGSRLVVEDTDHGGRPVLKNYGPSAAEAVEKFMADGGPGQELGFAYDREVEGRFGPFTNSKSGWLVRRGGE